MLDAASTAHMPDDLDIIRRIKECHLSDLAVHQGHIGAFVASIRR
jgi:hypothetical protein